MLFEEDSNQTDLPAARGFDGTRILVDRLRARYIAELKHDPAVVELQDKAAKSKTITLLFAAKDSLRSNAKVLQKFLSGGAALK